MLDFVPGTRPQGGTYTFAVNDAAATHSAGAITLIFQALLWPLLFANEATALTLRGVPMSPSAPLTPTWPRLPCLLTGVLVPMSASN